MCKFDDAGRRGSVVRTKTLIHEVVGSSSGSGVSAPQIRGLDDGASGIGQAKNHPTKSDLHLGKFHSADYCMRALHHQLHVLLQGRNAA